MYRFDVTISSAVLPILHLNGYKIGNPTVFGRASDADVRAVIQGNGCEVHFLESADPPEDPADIRDWHRPTAQR